MAAEQKAVGVYLPAEVAQQIHSYLASRPWEEVVVLINNIHQQSRPMTREPK